MKVDVLGLGMLGCMRRAFDPLQTHRGVSLDIASIPGEDPKTYAMIRQATLSVVLHGDQGENRIASSRNAPEPLPGCLTRMLP